jgi:hypothetical protein
VNPRNDRANLEAWGLTRPRPGHLTEYERRDRNRRRLGDWLPLLVVAVALAICLFLYALPNVLGWLEAGL